MKKYMIVSSATLILFSVSPCTCFFAPLQKHVSFARKDMRKYSSNSLKMSFMPSGSFIDSLSSQILSDNSISAASSFVDSFSSLILSDEAVLAATNAVTDTASASPGAGPFGFLAMPIEFLLEVIHSLLMSVGMSQNSWGISILMMTVVIKILTFPLTKAQLESTSKMQILQPKVESIKSQYSSNAEVMNQKIAELYQTEQINPLSGCIPSLVQLPVFIGLYRAVLGLAKDNKLDESFLWLPNLEGPVYGADPSTASDWILKGWENGAPSLGWHDTVAFLSLPVLLVISQFITQQLMQTQQSQDQQQNNIILKLLPLLIGWFAVNVPAALGIYWVTNNIVTTAFTMQIRNSLATADASGSTAVVPPPPSPAFTSKLGEKPSGFARPEVTAPVDAEVVPEKEEAGIASPEETRSSMQGEKKKRKRKKKKRN